MDQPTHEAPTPWLTLTASILEDAQRAGRIYGYYLSADLPDPFRATGRVLAHNIVKLLQEQGILQP